jgi:putative ABC transport system substrate-binding protein
MSLSDNLKSKTCAEQRRTIESLKWMGLLAIAFSLMIGGAVAEAQQPGKTFRIGFLDSSTASGSAVLVGAFRQELSKLGWTEGKNISIDYRFAEQKDERLPVLATELVRLKVDLIVASAPTSALAVKKATTTIPIVLAAGDPVRLSLVSNLAKPGGNLTGLSSLAPELLTKRLEILKETVPKLVRVGVLWWAAGHMAQEAQLNQVKDLRPAALALKIKLDEIETDGDPASLNNNFQTAKQKQVNGIITTASRVFFAQRKHIVELAARYRFPAIYPDKEFVDDGGLMSYGADYEDLFRSAAHYVDKILKGAKPADLPVQQATKFEFVINLKTAKQIGLAVPVRVLERANQVIK